MTRSRFGSFVSQTGAWLFLLGMPVGAAEIPFTAPGSVTGILDDAGGAVPADLDGDGDLDVIGTTDAGDEVAWWENTAGDASLTIRMASERSAIAPWAKARV